WTVLCFLEPGIYEAAVKVSEIEKAKGLQFYPQVKVFEVVDSPIVSGIEFTQLKVKLSGKISCHAAGKQLCGGFVLELNTVKIFHGGIVLNINA
ncbi:hypothetical protein L9F63_025786, partial [Diploptera punctata]